MHGSDRERTAKGPEQRRRLQETQQEQGMSIIEGLQRHGLVSEFLFHADVRALHDQLGHGSSAQ